MWPQERFKTPGTNPLLKSAQGKSPGPTWVKSLPLAVCSRKPERKVLPKWPNTALVLGWPKVVLLGQVVRPTEFKSRPESSGEQCVHWDVTK